MLNIWNPEAFSHDWVMPDNFHVRTKVMDTNTDTVHFDNQPFNVTYAVNRPMAEGRSLGANMTHAVDGMIVREMVRRCNYNPEAVTRIVDSMAGEHGLIGSKGRTTDDKMVQVLWRHYKETGFLSARTLDHLNVDNLGHVDFSIIRKLISTLPLKPFKILPIHDCFRCHPMYGNDLRKQYNLQLKMIAESDLLSSILSQLLNRKVHVGKLDPTLHQDIMESNYALS